MSVTRGRATLALASSLVAACTPMPPARPVGFSVYFLEEPAFVKLAYGAQDARNPGLLLECVRGSGVVRVADVASRPGAALPRTDPSRLIVRSGALRATLGISTEVADGVTLNVVRAPTSDPALQAFRRSGRLTVDYGAKRYALAADSGELDRVRRFFAACAGRNRPNAGA